MKVFVTGGAGFIGSQVTRTLLRAGHEVLTLVVPGADLWRLQEVIGDVGVVSGTLQTIGEWQHELSAWQPQSCLHLAWYTKPGSYLDSNENLACLQGTLELIQTLHACGCRQLVATGTCAEYEMKADVLSEDDRTGPETLYAAAKLACQVLGQQLTAQLGITFAWARLFSLYGPYEDPRRLVPSAIVGLQRGELLPASPGEQIRDYLHVEDVSSALVTLMEERAHGVYNVCSGQPLAIRDLLNTIGRLVGRPDLIKYGALPYRDWEPMFICGNNDRLKSLGWSPRYDLVAGLQNTVDWSKHSSEMQ